MKRTKRKWTKSIVVSLVSLLIVGGLPWHELRADANTHGEYDCSPLFVTYDQTATWDFNTQGEFTITNTSENAVDSWTLEIVFATGLDITNLWNGLNISDESTPANTLIIGNESYNAIIAPGDSVSFGMIMTGTEITPVAPSSIDILNVTINDYVIEEGVQETTESEELYDSETEEDAIETENLDISVAESDGSYDSENVTTEMTNEEISSWGIYSNSADLSLSGYLINICGNIYTGGNFLCQSSELNISGSLVSGGNVDVSTYLTGITDIRENVTGISMPVWEDDILANETNMDVLTSEALVSQDSLVNDGYYFSNDAIEINAASFGGRTIIVSEESITVNVDSFVGSEEVILYSRNGNITINGNHIEFNGLLYAPNGCISLNACDVIIQGSLVSDSFVFSGTTLNIDSSDDIVENLLSSNQVDSTNTTTPIETSDTDSYNSIVAWSSTNTLINNNYSVVNFFVDTKLYPCSDVQLLENGNIVSTFYDNGLYSSNADDIGGDGIYSTRVPIDTTVVGIKDYVVRIYFSDGSILDREISINIINPEDSFIIMDTVIDAVREYQRTDDFRLGDLSTKTDGVIAILAQLENDGFVESGSTHLSSSNIVSCRTSDGILLDFICEYLDGNCNQLGNTSDYEAMPSFVNNAPASLPSSGNVRVLYLIAFDGSDGRDMSVYESDKAILEEAGATVTLNYSPSYLDYQTCLTDGYDIVVFSGHGTCDASIPQFRMQTLISVNVNDVEAREFYNEESRKGYIAFAIDPEERDGDPESYPIMLTDDFFAGVYSGCDNTNTIVLSECCMAFGRNDEVAQLYYDGLAYNLDSIGVRFTAGFFNSIDANYSRDFCRNFILLMNSGCSAIEAFDGTVAIVGENDESYDHNGHIAYPDYYGDGSYIFSMGTVQNASFEYFGSVYGPVNYQNIYNWSYTGDVKPISNLTSSIMPTDGDYMAMITTGIGSGESSYYASSEGSIMTQTFRLPENATNVYFDVNMVSEEPMEWLGSRYDDSFEVLLIYTETGYERVVYTNSINTAEWDTSVNTNFDGGDNTVYQTGWETVCIDVSAYAGMRVSLVFVVYDVGDSAYDTAVLIDNIRFGD